MTSSLMLTRNAFHELQPMVGVSTAKRGAADRKKAANKVCFMEMWPFAAILANPRRFFTSLGFFESEVPEGEPRVFGGHHLELEGDRDDLPEVVGQEVLVESDPHRLPGLRIVVRPVRPAPALVHRNPP